MRFNWIAALIGLALPWAIYYYEYLKGVPGAGMAFLPNILLSIALAVIAGFIFRKK